MSGLFGGLLASLKSAIAKVYFLVSKADSSSGVRVERYVKTVFDSDNNSYSFYSSGEIIKRNGTTGEVIWVKKYSYNTDVHPNSIFAEADGIWFISTSSAPGQIIKIDFNGNVLEKRATVTIYAPWLMTSDLKVVTAKDVGEPLGKSYRQVWAPTAYSYTTGVGLATSSLETLSGNQTFVGGVPKMIKNSSNTIFVSGTGDGSYGDNKSWANVYKYTIGSATAQRYLIGDLYGIYNIALNVAPANSGNYYVSWSASNSSGLADANINMLRKITDAGQDSGYKISGPTDGAAKAMVVDSSETYLYALFSSAGGPVIKIVKFSITGTWSIVWERSITLNSGTVNFSNVGLTMDLDSDGDLVFGANNAQAPSSIYQALIFAKLKSDGSQVGTFTSGSGTITIASTTSLSLSSGNYGTSGTVSTVSLINETSTGGTTTSSTTITNTDVTSYYNSTEVKVIL